MRCNRCQFENIPGQDRCFKCGTVLEIADDAMNVHPPRMSAWRSPFRGLLRWFRRNEKLSEKLPGQEIRKGLDRLATDEMIGLALSVVPGLAHLIKRRSREVRLFVLLWAVLLSVGVFLYGSTAGFLCVGLAIGVHAWIGLQYGFLKKLDGFIERIAATLIIVACFGFLYWGVPRVVFHGYTGGHTALAVPAMRVQPGDYLLVRRTGAGQDVLPRGTLVLMRPARFRNYRRELFTEQPSMIGQIVGVPGDTIKIAEGFYALGDDPLDPERFPVPGWLQGRKTTVRVPSGSYFVSSPYRVQGRAGALTHQAVRDACLMKMEDIQGRAFMRWWPLQRRGFIE